MVSLRFHWVDYVVFGASLIVSLGIGVFFSLTGGRQQTTSEYLMGDRRLGLVPVAFSLLVSYVSAVTILGHPAEMYLYGTQFFMAWVGSAIGAVLAAVIWVPLLYPLQLTSVNQYLKMRFGSNLVKYLGTFFTVLGATTYTGICLFGPSTAVEQLTGFPVWASIILSGGVATIYTTIGGMKAVIWTDVFQALVLLAGIIAVVIRGCVVVGGGSRVWQLAEDGGRIIFAELDVDPRTRMTLWGSLLGSIIPYVTVMGVNQPSVQRYVSVPTQSRAKWSVIATAVGFLIVGPLACFAGLVLFAYYHDRRCDPLVSKRVGNPNQLMPLLVMEILNAPGVPGLFIAATFSASLSSASSAINACAALVWMDVLKEKLPAISEAKAALISKTIGLVAGIISIGLGLFVINVGGTVVQAVISVTQATLMPCFVIFTLGAFFPWANKWGVLTGGIIAGILPLWLNLGSYFAKSEAKALPTLTDGCPVNNATYLGNSTTPLFPSTLTDVSAVSLLNATSTIAATAGIPVFHKTLYSISHMWINSFSGIIGLVLGIFVSLLTGRTRAKEVDPSLLVGWVDKIWCCCLRGYRRETEGSRDTEGKYMAIKDTNGMPNRAEVQEETKLNSV